jgi:hypothetical protein
MSGALSPSNWGMPVGANNFASYAGLTPGSGPTTTPAGSAGSYTPGRTVFGKGLLASTPGGQPGMQQQALNAGWMQPAQALNASPTANQHNWGVAQPFGGAQSMPGSYTPGGQLNLASMAPGSQSAQMAQNIGGQNPRLNPNMAQVQTPQPSLTVPAGFTGAGTLQPPGFTGGLRRAPQGYRPPGRF